MPSDDQGLAQRLRKPIAALVLSAAGFAGIVGHEGFTDRAVVPVPGDRPTYGLGSTFKEDGSPVKMGDTITVPAAIRLSIKEIQGAEKALKKCVTGELTQGEYDSLVSLGYNVGMGAVCKSTMVRLHNAGQHELACAQFDRWTMFQGKDCRIRSNKCYGLVERRREERAQCEGRSQP